MTRIVIATALGLALLAACSGSGHRNGQDGMDGFGVAKGLQRELAR